MPRVAWKDQVCRKPSLSAACDGTQRDAKRLNHLVCREPVGREVLLTIARRAQAPVSRYGVGEPSVVLKEYIQRQSKR